MAKKQGAPTKYTDELFDSICEEIATTSRGTVHICKDHGIGISTFKDWIRDNDNLSAKYAHAKDSQADMLFEEIIAIADDGSSDTIQAFDKKGNPIDIEDKEWTSRSKLRIDARKWAASKLRPTKYGDRIEIDQKTEHIVKFK